MPVSNQSKKRLTYSDKSRLQLFLIGKSLATLFCDANRCPQPSAVDNVDRDSWFWSACAYYRLQDGIQVCSSRCALVAKPAWSRNWNWPGSTTDREPLGVVCHELGHHCDILTGVHKNRYSSEYSTIVRIDADEKPISSYCPNTAEWFAEMFRVFVTNPDLLRLIRPATYDRLCEDWKPVVETDWRDTLGADVPNRIVLNLQNKIDKCQKRYRRQQEKLKKE